MTLLLFPRRDNFMNSTAMLVCLQSGSLCIDKDTNSVQSERSNM